MVEAPAPQAEALAGPRPGDIARGLPTLFLAWFLVGLLAGVAGFSPHGRAAGTLVWSHVGRLLSTVGPSSPTPQSYDLPAPPAPRDTAPARPAAAG